MTKVANIMFIRAEARRAIAASTDVVTVADLVLHAEACGYRRVMAYGDNSDIWQAEGLPELIIPRTRDIADWPYVVEKLLRIFEGR